MTEIFIKVVHLDSMQNEKETPSYSLIPKQNNHQEILKHTFY